MPALAPIARLVRSPYHRREAYAYAHYVARRRVPIAAARRAWLTLRDAGHRGTPPGLELAAGLDGRIAPTTMPVGPRPQPAAPITWSIPPDDPEMELARHRFGATAMLLAAGPSDEQLSDAVEQARAWSRAHPPTDGAAGWDSYSVAERIAQWVLLGSAASRWGAPVPGGPPLSALVETHAAYLHERLELRGEATNNHLINDGRALYLAGMFLGDRRHLSLGRELLRYGARTMLTSSGFLREGSSHYHLLLCRTFLEVLASADACADHELRDELAERVREMVGRAGFFVRTRALALIGDVSPDVPPEFVRGVPLAAAALLGGGGRPLPPDDRPGWHRLFAAAAASSSDPPLPPRVESYPDAGYHRLSLGRAALTVYANPLGYVPAWSHGHADLGGFVLDWDNQPLLVDCGRVSYAPTSLGRYGRSVRSHNAISIDGFEPMVVHAHNGFATPMLPSYIGAPPTVHVADNGGDASLRLEHRGFGRIQADLAVERAFTVTGREVRIVDRVHGSGEHDVETYFHLHPSVAVNVVAPDAVELEIDSRRLVLRRTDGAPCAIEPTRARGGTQPAGWFSPRYGTAEAAVTLRLRKRVRLPARDEFVIEELA